MTPSARVDAAARLVRIATLVFAVSLLVGFVALQSFTQRYGTTAMISVEDTSSDPALDTAIREQEAAGLTCREEPALTDVILFQASGRPEVSVLTFEQAIAASSAQSGWVRRYCLPAEPTG